MRLKLLKDFTLGMISDDPSVDEAAQIELLRPEVRHFKAKFSMGSSTWIPDNSQIYSQSMKEKSG